MKNSILLFFFCCLFSTQNLNAQVYAKADATGANDGSSWVDAYTNLQAAIDASQGQPVWVAAGTWRPDVPGGAITATFLISDPIELYGGFAGTEINLSERDITANPTILSGDLDGNDVTGDFNTNRNDNVQTVLTITGDTLSLSIIDGFTISGGHANGIIDGPSIDGGGVHNTGLTSFKNCTFTDNFSINYGAGLFTNTTVENPSINMEIDSCAFIGNRAELVSGGLWHQMNSDGQSFSLTNSQFENNYSGISAGGAIILLWAENTDAIVDGCHFTANEARVGGGLYMQVRASETNYQVTNSNFNENRTDVMPIDFNNGGGFFGFFSDVSGNGSGTISDCSFSNNISGSIGGGIGLDILGAANIFNVVDCTFDSNSTTEDALDYGGGAMAVGTYAPSNPLLNISNCIFNGNTTKGTGGALDFYSTAATFQANINACEFKANASDNLGDAIHLTGNAGAANSNLTVVNSLFTEQPSISSGVIYNKFFFNCKILNSTIADNSTIGIYHESGGTMELQNNILHNPLSLNLFATAPVTSLGGNLVTDDSMEDFLDASDVLTDDPMFVGTGTTPYQLTETSLAINNGIITGNEPMFDLAGNDRIQNAGIDIGAYESPYDSPPNAVAEKLVDNTALSLSPNPTGGITTCSLDNSWQGELQVRIHNNLGQLVLSQTLEKTGDTAQWQLDLENLSSGTYHLIISNGQEMIRKRIVRK